MDGFITGSGVPGGKSCGCLGPCDCLPAEFTRLRYSFGMRLGAVELTDEQAYLVGKQRFHNIHCHGAGVLCGLQVGRFVWPQNAPPGTPSTVLRVTRGAALDGCGREVLVPCDQCIDVAAWFATNSAAIKPAPTAGLQRIWVALRYRECPSDPAALPRDPCGCDSGGCDYTRIRESFELRLFFGQSPACLSATFPAADALQAALNSADGDLNAQLDTLTAAACPSAPADWICLAAFDATLTAAGSGLTVTDISAPDNTIDGRRVLLSTTALQTLLLDLANSAGASGLLGDGPTIGAISFTGSGAAAGTLTIALNLITDPLQTTPVPLASGTFSPTQVQVQRFDTTAWDWVAVTPASANIATDGTKITIAWGAGDPPLGAGNFRVSLVSAPATPIVDQRMRPLRPLSYASDFGLEVDAANTLELTAVAV